MSRALNISAKASALWRLLCSSTFWLQASACAVVAWSLLHNGTGAAPAELLPSGLSTDSGAAAITTPAAPGTAAVGTPQVGAAASPLQLAASPSIEGAQLALSTVDVIVSRNDTLDRIFRRLKLNLTDLASLRTLPGVRAALDSLRPGESLHFTHRDGALFGLERRLNETQTLKVSRDGEALKADVLENPVETRARTVRGVIDSSLFEAVETAGAHDQTAVSLADIFGWDIDFVLDVRSGDTFTVTYTTGGQTFTQTGHF